MATLQITDKLLFLERSEWDTSGAPRQQVPVDPQDREYAIMHHVVATDVDLTPNKWENLDEIKVRMRGLRVARPDLGSPVDNPYNWNGFMMADSFMGPGGLVVCEGRGHLYRGAHTIYHNRTGVALSMYADLQTYDTNVLPYLSQISRFWGWAKYELPLPNLATALPPNGGDVWYHNQLNQKNGLGFTSCCGRHLIEHIHQIVVEDPTIVPPVIPEVEMQLRIVIKNYGIGPFWYLTTHPFAWRQHITNLAYMDYMQKNEDWPTDIDVLAGNEAAIFEGIQDLGPVPVPL